MWTFLVRGKTSKVVIAAVLAVCVAFVLVPAAFAQSQGPVPRGLKVGLPTSSDGGVLKLTWDVTSPASITGYKVYRSASPDGGFKSVFSDTADTRLNVMQFMDAGLEPGATYYYRVTLIDSGGKETSPSNVARGVLPALAGGRTQADTREKGKHIIISVTENRIWFLENGVLVRTHLC